MNPCDCTDPIVFGHHCHDTTTTFTWPGEHIIPGTYTALHALSQAIQNTTWNWQELTQILRMPAKPAETHEN